MANFMAWVHEQFLKALRAAVLRGQEETILNDWSNGDWCLGFGSEPIAGSEVGRRGRNPKPRKRLVINRDRAEWVVWMFQRFFVDGWSLGRITRELTRRGAPKDHRSHTPGWHRDYVKRVLRNEKYVGVWARGRNTNVRNPFTGQISQEGRPLEEVAKWTRLRPTMRIIDDDMFNGTQVMLDALEQKWHDIRTADGRLTNSRPDEATPRNLLQRLVKCGACGGPFRVCGAYGKYLGCAKYPRGLCGCKTYLLRSTAEAKLLQLIGGGCRHAGEGRARWSLRPQGGLDSPGGSETY